MKLMAMFVATFLFWGLKDARSEDSLRLIEADKEVISRELEKEAGSDQHDTKTREFLKKISEAFKNTKKNIEVEINDMKEDCADCSHKEKTRGILTKLGMGLGKGASWVSVKTAKPFLTATSFVRGAVEKGDTNQDIVNLFNFFLKHEAEFENLYLEAGTPDEMMELMLMKMEEIMERKSKIILKDFLMYAGIKKEVPESLIEFELTSKELASISSKLDPSFINKHPEFQDVKPLVGEMTKEDLTDLVSSGYMNKIISLENYEKMVPSLPELIATVVGQLYVPKLALGIISKSLASLYFTPVVLADIGAGVSTAICLQKDTQEKFGEDKDLKMFCSYVTNKAGLELMKGRAKGYVAGKKFHHKVSEKIQRFKDKRAEKKKENLVPELQ